jgi:hypothetical protein
MERSTVLRSIENYAPVSKTAALSRARDGITVDIGNLTGRTADGLHPMLISKEKSLGMLERSGANYLTTVAPFGLIRSNST